MLTQQEFDDILADTSKRIEGDIVWTPDDRHNGAAEFRAAVLSDAGYPLFIAGWHRPQTASLTYALVYGGARRIYAINFGHLHTNPSSGERVGTKHKHYWTEDFQDRMAYNPHDVTEPWHRPIAVWRQFCAEAGIDHRGPMYSPD